MAEKITSAESKETQGEDLLDSAEKRSSIEKKLSLDAKEAAEKHGGEKIKAKKEVEQALSGAEKGPVGAERSEKRARSATRGAKKQQYQATMRRVEARLPAYQRRFSRIIHNPTVDAVSNVTSKTIARPSGLLGGAVASFLGLLFIYLNARRIGFEYPSGSAFIFFISIGWLVGILVEYIVVAVRKMINKR